jgi:hypothetical protein
VGYGKVLTFFGPDGRVLESYTLEQLLPFDEILEVPITASSRWWGSNALFFFRQGQKQFAFVTERGTIGVFELATGRRLPLSSALKMAVRQEALQITRKEVRHPNPFCRARAALLLGTLGDRSDIPALKALLHDPTSSCRVIMSYWRQPQKRYEVQLAAGKALARLLGAEAVPLRDAKLPGANRYMTLEWIELLKKTGAAYRLKSLQSVGFRLVTVRVRFGNGVRRGLVGRAGSGVGLPAKDQGSAKRHVAATTNHAEFGQPEAVFEGIGKARQRHQIVELPLVQRGMGFALRAPTKVASWWGQGFAIIVIVVPIVAIIAVRRVGQWVGNGVVAIIGVIGSPKGFSQVGNGVIGKGVGVRRGLVGRISGVLVGVLTVPVPQKAMPP